MLFNIFKIPIDYTDLIIHYGGCTHYFTHGGVFNNKLINFNIIYYFIGYPAIFEPSNLTSLELFMNCIKYVVCKHEKWNLLI